MIDEDLRRSVFRSSRSSCFARLVAELCTETVCAVLCIEASRLTCNRRDWHHLINLCGLARALVVDSDGVYDPCLLNDRLLFGLKATMGEFEHRTLSGHVARKRFATKCSAANCNCTASRLLLGNSGEVEKDPGQRIRQALDMNFAKMQDFGSIRRVFLGFVGKPWSVWRKPAGCLECGNDIHVFKAAASFRLLIQEIVPDVDESADEIVLMIHR